MLSELQAIAEALSRQLGRAVAFDDPSLRLLVHTAHQGGQVDQVRLDAVLNRQTLGPAREHLIAQGIAKATGPMRVSGRDDLSMLPRVCAPVRYGSDLLGYLWMLDNDEELTEDQLRATRDAADAAGAVMYRERLLGDIQRGQERETLRDLLTDDVAVRRHAAESLRQSNLLLATSPVVALVVRSDAPDEDAPADRQPALESALMRAVRRTPPHSCMYLARADHGVVLAARGRGALDDARLEALAASVQQECVSALADGADVMVGVGAPAKELVDVATSYWQARRAIDVARVVPSLGPVSWWSRLGVYGQLVQLGLDGLPQGALPASLERLFELDRTGVLTDTLEVYLDNVTDPSAAAAALSIHRTTLYYRLGRVAELTGLDLKDGGERLAVHLGLKLARLVGRRT